MSEDFLATIAHVECRSEGRGEEHPIAVIIGEQRFAIVDILDRAMITSVEAGDPVRHRLWVEIADGRRCELVRTLPTGKWRVRMEARSDASDDAGGEPGS